MKYLIHLVVGLFMIGWNGYAQSVSDVRGYVHSGGVPIEFASVVFVGKGIGTNTNESGRFIISSIPHGSYTVRVSMVGYKPWSKSVSVPLSELIIELEEEPTSLEAVVISGTMKEVTKLQSPIPVEVYTPALFLKNPTPNIFESLNVINGVQPQINCNVCNTGDIHINGLEGPYTMILIDGMPIVSSLSTVYGLSGIPNHLVKRIEVVKGPASTLYGSEAVAGLINIITKEPFNLPRIQTDVFATSVGEWNADMSIRMKSGKSHALWGINYFSYNQARDINNDNFTDVPIQNRFSIFNKWDIPLRHGKNGSLAWRYFHENRWGGELQWSEQYRGSDIYYGESIVTNRFELIGTLPLTQQKSMKFDYSYNYHTQDSYYGVTRFQASQQVGFMQITWNQRMGKHDLLAGIPFRFIHYDDNTPGTAEVSGINQPSVTFLPGIFIQDEFKFAVKSSLLAGVRLDHHNIHGTIFTPRISLRYAPTTNSVFRITSGTGYRVVNLFTEDHAALTGAREVVITDELQPEQSWNVNLNYTHTVPLRNGFFNMDASLFCTYFSNKIIGDFLTDPDKILYNNLDGYAVSKGFTFNADINFKDFTLMMGTTLMDVYSILAQGSQEIKTPQLFAPNISGTFAFTWKPSSLWALDLTGRINGPMHLPVQENDYRPSMSPWVPILNFQISRVVQSRTNKHSWELYGGLKNLINFIPENPLMHPDDPFDRPGGIYFDESGNPRPETNPNGYTFDTAYNYAPLQGLKVFAGIRFTLQ